MVFEAQKEVLSDLDFESKIKALDDRKLIEFIARQSWENSQLAAETCENLNAFKALEEEKWQGQDKINKWVDKRFWVLVGILSGSGALIGGGIELTRLLGGS
jgi:hypothetical protein